MCHSFEKRTNIKKKFKQTDQKKEALKGQEINNDVKNYLPTP